VKAYRRSEAFERFAADKLSLGAEIVRDLGNLYTASLPAWIGAAFEDALHRDLPLAGRTLLALGYGSGDAAEAIPLRVVDGWQDAAKRIGMRDALKDAIDLDRESYEALHDGHPTELDDAARGFVVERVGDRYDPEFQDLGIEYYAYRG
jgi:hydroxymethylglutaryl-CoA synthase